MALSFLSLSKKNTSHDLIGIDLNNDLLKVAHVKVSSLKREVQYLTSVELRGMSDDNITALIVKTIADLKLKTPKIFITVPLHAVITRSIEIPSRDPEEIRGEVKNKHEQNYSHVVERRGATHA